MRKIIFLFIVGLIVSCTEEPKIDYALLSGKIENPKSDKVLVYDGNEFSKEILLNKDGTFVDTLRLETGYYTLEHGREITYVFMSPGHDLKLNLNTEEFDESISFSGKGSANNNYLVQKVLLDQKLSGMSSETFALEESEFLKVVDKLNEEKVALLNKSEELDEEFIELENKNLRFEHLSNLQYYPDAHAYYAQKPDFKVSDDFLNPLNEVDYNNAEDYRLFMHYKQLVQSYYNNKLNKSDDAASVFNEINKNTFPALKNDLAKNLSYRISPSNENNEAYYNGIIAMSTDEELKEKVEKKYNKVKELAKGKPSPVFTDYENHKGGTMSLDDLKGKYVYVDVWATWCGPCKVEIPHLKEVEHKYKDRNIHFVSTSIDKAADHNKWVEMIKDKELGGIQLMADNDWNSKFVKDYAIEGIPRFILIDPNGNIVSADAPRPSNPKLIEMLDGLDI